ncbi:MAG: adenylyl-sulfate kinase [Chloroflexi bacterium]|nr:adenylyl-sulfate kinase [Chloroflexota bacterium]
MKPIIILTGPAASGKNTIANVYASHSCERCAVIDGDVVRQMLRQPHAAPWDEPEGLAQHRLGVHNNCLLAKSFAEDGCEVVILDVLWSDLAARYREELDGYPLRIVRLLPSWEAALKRLHGRPPSISDSEARWTYDAQLALTDFDLSIDNSTLSAGEVAAKLAAYRDERAGSGASAE